MTQNGNIVNAHYDKFRQINRFLEYIEDILPSLPTGRELRILDFGCGKSYLTFAIYYYLKVLKGYPVRITGLDLKEDVIRNCNELAVKYMISLNFYAVTSLTTMDAARSTWSLRFMHVTQPLTMHLQRPSAGVQKSSSLFLAASMN